MGAGWDDHLGSNLENGLGRAGGEHEQDGEARRL